MGRPVKKGLVYFYNDVDFYQDIKIRKLIRRKGGQAATVYHILLCEIYRQGYYLQWDDDIPFLIMEVCGFDETYIKDVIDYCIQVGLFDKHLYDEDGVLTSIGIQERYLAAGKDAKRKVGKDLPYLLVSIEKPTLTCYDEDILSSSPSKSDKDISSEETIVNSEETIVNGEEMPVNSEKSTQRKEKERKDDVSTSSTATSRVRDGDENPKDDDSVDVKDVVKELKADRDWLLSMQRRHGIEARNVVGWLNAFVVECDCRGTCVHVDRSDVMRHFNDWLVKQIKPKRGNKGKVTGPTQPNYQEVWVRAKAELCSCVSAEQSAATFDLMEYAGFNAEDNKLVVTVPGEEAYHRLESQPYLGFLQVTLRKFFGQGVKLGYKYRNVIK